MCKQYFILLLFIIMFLFNCNNTKIDLIDTLFEKCRYTNEISISKVTTFDWDKMFVFKEGVNSNYIQDIIGSNFDEFVDLELVIVFLLDDEVVYYETLTYNPEIPYKVSLFYSNASIYDSFLVFNKDQTFEVIPFISNGKTFYELLKK